MIQQLVWWQHDKQSQRQGILENTYSRDILKFCSLITYQSFLPNNLKFTFICLVSSVVWKPATSEMYQRTEKIRLNSLHQAANLNFIIIRRSFTFMRLSSRNCHDVFCYCRLSDISFLDTIFRKALVEAKVFFYIDHRE